LLAARFSFLIIDRAVCGADGDRNVSLVHVNVVISATSLAVAAWLTACKRSPSGAADASPAASAAPVASASTNKPLPPVSFASSRYAEAILVPKVPVAKLLQDYKLNELRADALYKGKRLQIAGKAGKFKRDITNTIFMTVGTGAPFEHPEAQCFFDDAYASTVASLTKGETVTVLCTVAGLMMNVLMKDCAFAGAPVQGFGEKHDSRGILQGE
jgi:hypothetical protein